MIAVRGRVSSFGSARVLDQLNLSVAPGEVHGLLGPNGAGKTTMLRILLGLRRADGGHVQVLGGDPWHDAVRLHRRLAYVPGDVTRWPSLFGMAAFSAAATIDLYPDVVQRIGAAQMFNGSACS